MKSSGIVHSVVWTTWHYNPVINVTQLRSYFNFLRFHSLHLTLLFSVLLFVTNATEPASGRSVTEEIVSC
jgi:hypothetical protein